MRFRPDLVEKLTPEMLKKSVALNNPRYKPEPLFSRTGTGSLLPASTELHAQEEKLSMEITRKLMTKSGKSGKKSGKKK